MLNFIETCLTEASNTLDLSLMKAKVVTEAARRELSINYDEAELKVMQENGTDDDLAYYYREAENGLVDTVVKAIQKIRDALVKFFSELKSKILSLINKKENTEAIEKIEKKTKLFPLLGRKKILIQDADRQEKNSKEAFSKLNRLKAKAASGQGVDAEEIDEVKKSFIEEHKATIGVASAITITVGAALAWLKFGHKRVTKSAEDAAKSADSIIADCTKMAERIDDPVSMQKIADTAATVSKTAAESSVKFFTDLLSQVKKAVKGFGKSSVDVAKAAAAVGESTDNPDTLMNDKDMERVTKSIASTNGDMTEFGDDPASDIPGYGDDPDDTSDVWDDVMGTSAGLDLDDTDECGDSFESTFDRLFEKVSQCNSDSDYHCNPSSSKPSNEKIIADLYADISSEVKGGMDYSHQYATESAFDRLMDEISNLSFD